MEVEEIYNYNIELKKCSKHSRSARNPPSTISQCQLVLPALKKYCRKERWHQFTSIGNWVLIA